MSSTRLREDHRAILGVLAKEPGDGWMRPVWIAERCGHAFDTPWASGKLPSLRSNGLIERASGGGYYRITAEGRSALDAVAASP